MLVAGSPCCDSSPQLYYFLYIIDRKAQMSLDTKFMFYSHEKKVGKSRFWLFPIEINKLARAVAIGYTIAR
jgi:hypothetical protein